MPKMSLEKIKQSRPERPAALDKLNMLQGEWENAGEFKMMGVDEILKTKGTSQLTWESDGWYLVEHSEFEMGEMGKMKGIGIWTWDPKHEKYLTWWFSDWGDHLSGMVTYNELTHTWTTKARGTGMMGSTVGRGTIKIVDDDTMSWTWSEWPAWDVLRLFKVLDMKGLNKRK